MPDGRELGGIDDAGGVLGGGHVRHGDALTAEVEGVIDELLVGAADAHDGGAARHVAGARQIADVGRRVASQCSPSSQNACGFKRRQALDGVRVVQTLDGDDVLAGGQALFGAVRSELSHAPPPAAA